MSFKLCVCVYICLFCGRTNVNAVVCLEATVCLRFIGFFNGWITIDKGELFVKIITDFSGELAYYVFRSICILSLK